MRNRTCLSLAILAILSLPLAARQNPAPAGGPAPNPAGGRGGQGAAPGGGAARGNHADTEVYEPVPAVVTPASTLGAPPSDAIVLFDGKNLDAWVMNRDPTQPASWTVADGILTVKKGQGSGNIETKRKFKNYQIHLEWKIPTDITGQDQARGNSGLFLASTGSGDAGYELQILDSYQNKTYVNGQAASVYKQYPPLVNASGKPGDWQSYDVVWTKPTFNADGSVKTPAYVTAFHNGVLVQNHVELKGETVYVGLPSYKAFESAPIKLQAHGDASPPISFRNIWVRDLPDEPQAPVILATPATPGR